MQIRSPELADVEALTELRYRLWPDAPRQELRDEVEALLAGKPQSTLPVAIFVAQDNGKLIGFVEVGLRSHVDGCDTSRPCGFLEGWYVEPEYRRRGVGGELVRRAETWCQEHGCTELGSDTWIDHGESQRAHAALGFEIVDRCVHFRKNIK
jgi:aminoglycoside 6'-N-acetyltransferase I